MEGRKRYERRGKELGREKGCKGNKENMGEWKRRKEGKVGGTKSKYLDYSLDGSGTVFWFK